MVNKQWSVVIGESMVNNHWSVVIGECSVVNSQLTTGQWSRPCRLWWSFDELLGRGRAPVSSDIDASTLHCFFDDKVAGVRASTDGADSQTFTTVPLGCELRLFTPVSSAVVVELVKKLPDKQCTSNPFPTWLLKQSVKILAPFLC